MTRSRRERADLECPSCGRAFHGDVWLVVDRAERPDLVQRLMAGSLDEAVCPHCGVGGAINHPMLLHDPARMQVFCALPLSVQGQAAARALVGELLEGLVAALSPADRRPYLREVEIVAELDGLRAILGEQHLAEDALAEDRSLALALHELLHAAGQDDFQRVIAQHRQLLVSARAEQALDELAVDARQLGDRELQRRIREAKALLGRMRAIVAQRRRSLSELLDRLAPLDEQELGVLPRLRRMLDALDPQEVYAARIDLSSSEQITVDRIVERLAEEARSTHEVEALAFLRNLQALPSQ